MSINAGAWDAAMVEEIRNENVVLAVERDRDLLAYTPLPDSVVSLILSRLPVEQHEEWCRLNGDSEGGAR